MNIVPAWLLIQIWLITLLPSLIARRWVGPHAKGWLPPPSVSNGWRLIISVCGWVRRDPVFLWSGSDQLFALFHYSSFDYMCFTVMFHRLGRGPLCGPNICLGVNCIQINLLFGKVNRRFYSRKLRFTVIPILMRLFIFFLLKKCTICTKRQVL